MRPYLLDLLSVLHVRQCLRRQARPMLPFKHNCPSIIQLWYISNSCSDFSTFFKIFFLVWHAPFGCLYYFPFFFCHQVVHLIHLVFRWTRELNPRPRTMAQTASPWRSPLDQGASPSALFISFIFKEPILTVFIFLLRDHSNNIGHFQFCKKPNIFMAI